MKFYELSLVIAVCLLATVTNSSAQDRADPLPSNETLIPHQLLPLIHAPEVQTELKLSDRRSMHLKATFAKMMEYGFGLAIYRQRRTIKS